MDKYLMTQSWLKRLAPDLKVHELSRITYQQLIQMIMRFTTRNRLRWIFIIS